MEVIMSSPVQECSRMESDNGSGASKLTRSQKKNRKRAFNQKLDANLGSLEKREDNGNLKKMETSVGETSTGSPASKRKRKKMKNTHSESGGILSTRESAQEGLGTTKVLEIKSGETVSAKTATPDANIVSKGDHTEVSDGKTDVSETINLNVNGKEEKKKKPKSKKKQPTLGEILNPQYLQTLEPAKGETELVTTSTDDQASKKRKRKKNKNSESGDILSTRESTQEGLSTTKILEIKSGETVSSITATPDAKMGESETANLNVNGKEKKKRKSKTKIKRPTLGEILNPRYLELLDASNGATNSKKSEKSKSQDTVIVDAAEPADLEITAAKSNEALARKSHETEVKEITQVATSRKKLIILDVNGLLGDVLYHHRPQGRRADAYIRKRAIFKRPYLDDFLCFCFQRFHVGIWSSRAMENLDPVVDFLLRHWKKKLFFLWDGSKCTNSGTGSLEARHKPIVVKDLRKIWGADDPDSSWVKGTFDESNTLLVDDSPYKALLNPKHTGIFPASYSYKDMNDNFLGPKGELQTYLEGLAAADDVKTYVEQHPFGQVAIDEQSPHWDFYLSVIDRLNGINTNVRHPVGKKKF